MAVQFTDEYFSCNDNSDSNYLFVDRFAVRLRVELT
jgi:hypothetical protein